MPRCDQVMSRKLVFMRFIKHFFIKTSFIQFKNLEIILIFFLRFYSQLSRKSHTIFLLVHFIIVIEVII